MASLIKEFLSGATLLVCVSAIYCFPVGNQAALGEGVASSCAGVTCAPAPNGATCEARFSPEDKCCPRWVCTNGQTAYGSSSSKSQSWSSNGGNGNGYFYSTSYGSQGSGSSSFGGAAPVASFGSQPKPFFSAPVFGQGGGAVASNPFGPRGAFPVGFINGNLNQFPGLNIPNLQASASSFRYTFP